MQLLCGPAPHVPPTVGLGLDQAACSACSRAGARGGARACRPNKCARFFSMTGVCRMAAIMSTRREAAGRDRWQMAVRGPSSLNASGLIVDGPSTLSGHRALRNPDVQRLAYAADGGRSPEAGHSMGGSSKSSHLRKIVGEIFDVSAIQRDDGCRIRAITMCSFASGKCV